MCWRHLCWNLKVSIFRPPSKWKLDETSTFLDSFNSLNEVYKKNLIYVLIKFKPAHNFTAQAMRPLTSERKKKNEINSLGGGYSMMYFVHYFNSNMIFQKVVCKWFGWFYANLYFQGEHFHFLKCYVLKLYYIVYTVLGRIIFFILIFLEEIFLKFLYLVSTLCCIRILLIYHKYAILTTLICTIAYGIRAVVVAMNKRSFEDCRIS